MRREMGWNLTEELAQWGPDGGRSTMHGIRQGWQLAMMRSTRSAVERDREEVSRGMTVCRDREVALGGKGLRAV